MKGEKIDLARFEIGGTYSRAEIANVGGVTSPQGSRDPYWSSGIVVFDNAVLLLVTLEKTHFSYHDSFDEESFWWQSQTQQTQLSPVIRALATGALAAELFVRIRAKGKGGKALPFVYCGRLSAPAMEGDRPVTCLFQSLDYTTTPTPPLAAVYSWRVGAGLSPTEVVRRERVRTKSGPGQGRQLDAKLRKAIELYAMRQAYLYYSGLGYTIKDTSQSFPYDLECVKGPLLRRIEVKGTLGGPDVVSLTVNEVDHARSGSVPVDLFIVHSISRDVATDRLSGGATLLVENWFPRDEDLYATEFRYRVPVKSSLA